MRRHIALVVGEKHAPRADRAAALATYFLRLPRLLDAGRLVALDPLLLFARRLRAIDLTVHTGLRPFKTQAGKTQKTPAPKTFRSRVRACHKRGTGAYFAK